MGGYAVLAHIKIIISEHVSFKNIVNNKILGIAFMK